MNFKVSLCFLIQVLIYISNISCSQYISCTPIWNKASNGEFPPDSVEGGNGDLIVRALVGSEFITGRLSIADLKAYIPTDTGPIEFTEYEVLGITPGCITQWIALEDTTEWESLNPIGSESSYVARAEFDGYILSGSIISDLTMKIAYEGATHSITDGTIEVLTSVYPLLETDLTDFTYGAEEVEDLEKNGILKVISSEQVENLSEDVLSSTYHVNFVQTIQEFFTLTEEKSWQGVQTVRQTLLLWFGSPIISETYDVSISNTILLNRERTLSVTKDLVLVNVSNINICSYAYMIIDDEEEHKIPYTATATFKGDQLTASQVRTVLTSTDRTDIISEVGDSVRARIYGTISGKFALRVVSRTEPNEDGISPCIDYANKYNSKKKYNKL